jgi:putative Holliday junction resolvase
MLNPACFVGLDVGTTTIGLARADERSRMAFPLSTLSRKGVRNDVQRLIEQLRRDRVLAWVVGLPIQLDGQEGRSARLARQVGEALAATTSLPVHYQDERYSSVEAELRLMSAGLDGRQRRERIDQAAAAIILQDWLDAQRREEPEGADEG